MFTQKCINKLFLYCFVCNSQKLETTRMSFNMWLVRQGVVPSCHRTLFSNKMYHVDTCIRLGWISRKLCWLKYPSPKMLHTICMGPKMLQTCLTVCDHMDCSPPYSSVCGIHKARILESPGDLHDPEINPDLLHWQEDSLPLVPPGQPYTCHKGNPTLGNHICDSTNTVSFLKLPHNCTRLTCG